jgi:hypothetical protein
MRLTLNVKFKPSYPVDNEIAAISVFKCSLKLCTSCLDLDSQGWLVCTLSDVEIDDKQVYLHFQYWSSTEAEDGGHEVPLACIASARVCVYDLLKKKKQNVPLLDAEGHKQATGDGLVIMVIKSSGVSEIKQTDEDEKKNQQYEDAVMQSFKKWRPDDESHWYIDANVNGTTLPLLTCIQLAWSNWRIGGEYHEDMWKVLLEASLARYSLKSWDTIRDDDMKSRVINSMLVLPFTGYVYISDFVRRENGRREPTDTWQILRARPRMVGLESVSFDCEDAAHMIIESISAIVSGSFKSPLMRSVQRYIAAFDIWMMIGDIKVAGGKRVAHAYVALTHPDRSTVILEGTLLHDGVWSKDKYNTDERDDRFYREMSLVKQPAMVASGVHWRNHIQTCSPISVVKKECVYGELYISFHVSQSTITQYICEMKTSAHSFFDDPYSYSKSHFHVAYTEKEGDGYLSLVDSVPYSVIAVSIRPDTRLDPIPTGKQHIDEYWIRPSTYESKKDVIHKGIHQLYGKQVQVQASELHWPCEFKVIRLLVVYSK